MYTARHTLHDTPHDAVLTWHDRGVSCDDMARQGGVVRRHGKTGGCRAACRVMLGLDVYANYVVPCMSCDVVYYIYVICVNSPHDIHDTTPVSTKCVNSSHDIHGTTYLVYTARHTPHDTLHDTVLTWHDRGVSCGMSCHVGS